MVYAQTSCPRKSTHQIRWDLGIQTDNPISARRQDLELNKQTNKQTSKNLSSSEFYSLSEPGSEN